MDVLAVSLTDVRGGLLPLAAAEVQVNEAGSGFRGPDAVRSSEAYFRLRPARPLLLEIRVVPRGDDLWRIQQCFRLTDALHPVDEATLPSAVSASEREQHYVSSAEAARLFFQEQGPHPLSFTGRSGSVTAVSVLLPRVRDVLPKAARLLRDVPRERIERPGHPDGFDVPADVLPLPWALASKRLAILQSPIHRGDDLHFEDQTVAPDMVERVFEVRQDVVPKLLSVSCPTALLDAAVKATSATSATRPSLPMVLHFRPFARGAGFFDHRPGGAGYPWDWDYLFFTMWAERDYVRSPLVRPKVSHGFCYQIAASGKLAALVCPVPRGSSFGSLMHFEWSFDILSEIQAALLRSRGIYRPAHRPGRTALSGFSAGCNAIADVVSALGDGHPVREVYLHDPPEVTADEILRSVVGWADRIGGDACVRSYGRFSEAAHAQHGLVDVSKRPASSSPLRTYSNLGPARWAAAARRLGNPTLVAANLHTLVAATTLTDALRRSLI